MNTSKEKTIDFKGLLRDFFGSSYDTINEEKNEKKLLEWKKANNVSDKNIINFEKMVSHNDKVRKTRKKKEKMNLAEKSKTDNTKLKTQVLEDKNNKNVNQEKEQERGA